MLNRIDLVDINIVKYIISGDNMSHLMKHPKKMKIYIELENYFKKIENNVSLNKIMYGFETDKTAIDLLNCIIEENITYEYLHITQLKNYRKKGLILPLIEAYIKNVDKLGGLNRHEYARNKIRFEPEEESFFTFNNKGVKYIDACLSYNYITININSSEQIRFSIQDDGVLIMDQYNTYENTQNRCLHIMNIDQLNLLLQNIDEWIYIDDKVIKMIML